MSQTVLLACQIKICNVKNGCDVIPRRDPGPYPLGQVTKYITFQVPIKALDISDTITEEIDNTFLGMLQSFLCMITDPTGLHSVL